MKRLGIFLVWLLVTATLAAEGATFVIPFGKEPRLNERPDGPSIIFDWAVAETVAEALGEGIAKASICISGPSWVHDSRLVVENPIAVHSESAVDSGRIPRQRDSRPHEGDGIA